MLLIMSPGVTYLKTPVTVTAPLGQEGDLMKGKVIQARLTEPGLMQWEISINNKKFCGQIYMGNDHRRIIVIDMGLIQPGESLLPPVCFINAEPK